MPIPFSPPPGLNSDDTTFAAEGRWADGNNVRFRLGKPQTIGGWVTTYTNYTLASGGTGFGFHSVFAWRDAAGVVRVVFGAYQTLRASTFGSSASSDITPAGVSGEGDRQWSFATWGDNLLCSPYLGQLYLWQRDTAVVPAAVATAPASIVRMLVTPERQVLAFGCNEEVSATFNGRCIRGSDLEDYTDWTTSASNNAFEHILDGPGYIVTAEMVGPYVAVWTNTGLHLGQFVGDPGQAYRFDRVSENCGLIGPKAVTVVKGAAFWMTPDLRILRWAPGAPPEEITCPISQDFADNVIPATGQYYFAFHNPKFNEIMFFYPDNRDATSDQYPSRYIAFSLDDGTWFRGQMLRSAMHSSPELLGGAASCPSSIIAVDPTSALAQNVYMHEVGTTAAGSALTWHIQSADQYLDNSQRRMMIRGVVPDFEEQTGDVSLSLYTKDRPQSSQVTKGPYTLTAASTKKDFRASGKIVAVKLSGGAASGSYMRLGKPLFDVVPMGER